MFKLYALMDRKAGRFLKPNPAHTDAEVERSLVMAMRQGGNSVADFPEDYSLYEVGVFDDNEGIVTPTIPPRHILNVSSLASLSKAVQNAQG